MGFFSKKEPVDPCVVCGKDSKASGQTIKKGEYLCKKCFRLLRIEWDRWERMPVEKREDEVSKLKDDLKKLADFKVSRIVGQFLYIDDTNKKWYTPDGAFMTVKRPKIFDFSNIVDFWIVDEDGNSTITQGGTGRAVAGGLLFGGTGAIAGGVTGDRISTTTSSGVYILVKTDLPDCPETKIDFGIIGETKRQGGAWTTAINRANECMAALKEIYDPTKKELLLQSKEAVSSTADEIKKFKELLDCGAITEEEYQAKKTQLLKL